LYRSDEIMRKSSRTYIFGIYILVEQFNSSFFSNPRIIHQIVQQQKGRKVLGKFTSEPLPSRDKE
jgi:hypothetical protein